jgi:glycosyltransferase involved in cell wall biosynthesis
MLCNVVLSTEPRGGKGGVATVIPMYLEALSQLGRTKFIATHSGRNVWGKFAPWLASFFRCLILIATRRRTKIVFHLHPGSGFCLIRMLILAIFLRGIARQRVLVFMHTPYLEKYLESMVWKAIIGALVRCAHRTIVLTRYARNLLEKYGLAERTDVIPNPFRGNPRISGRTKEVGNVINVLTMGRLVKGKGIIETVKAMVALPENYRLSVAGDGDLAEELKREIQSHGLDSRVRLLGWISGSEKDELLASSSVFCLPSKVDSFGMSFVEAQYYGLPIVALRHPPVMEVIRHDAAIFVDSLAPDVLALAIEKANELNGSLSPGSGAHWVDDSFGVGHTSLLLRSTIFAIIG